ncbi:MAG: hypothetical protein M9904_07095 [Chitinophagaceae bacterium]|nr:hypothetical protein [Chitinophagaceae bacterium]
MRVLLVFIVSFFSVTAGAQTVSPLQAPDHLHQYKSENKYEGISGYVPGKKWFVSRYSGLSSGFVFFNGGSANYISAPIGLQLNRRLNNNWYAFAGVSAAPAYIHFNGSFPSSAATKQGINNGLFKSNYGVYSGATLGLMYMNEEKTFSISGSIGVQRSSSPLFFVQPVTYSHTPASFLPATSR